MATIQAAMCGDAEMNASRSFRILSAIAVVMAAIAGCASTGSSAGPADPEETDITVSAIPAVDLAGLYIAQSDNLFAQQGLHVTIKPISSSAVVIASQLAGKVDISAGAYVGYISAQAAGAKFRILAMADILQPDVRAVVTTGNSPVTGLADLSDKKVGVNGTNSIGTLLISMLLSEQGMSPKKVDFVTDSKGFPDMPGQLQHGAWNAAFLAEPYITSAEEEYGDQAVADLDQGGAVNFPIDGYVATSAWTQQHPKAAAAFVRAIEEGQAIARSNTPAVRAAIEKYDQLTPEVTAAMALPGFPVGPPDESAIQGVAQAMLQYGILSKKFSTAVNSGALVQSMFGPSS
jgi:NitT/TauT family transport system substrate-binding protein